MCVCIIRKLVVRPHLVTDSDAQQLSIAIMANFQTRIPPDVKVSLPVNVDDSTVTPAKEFTTLTKHFSTPDPFVHDKLRALVESRAIGRLERVAKVMKWHRDMRARMLGAPFLNISDEAMTIEWILSVLKTHHDYKPLAQSWRASGPPSPMNELEVILASEETENDEAKKLNNQMYTILDKMNEGEYTHGGSSSYYALPPSHNP